MTRVFVSCPAWMTGILSEEQKTRLAEGKSIELRGKIYSLCGSCWRVIRVDGVFGSLHLCR